MTKRQLQDQINSLHKRVDTTNLILTDVIAVLNRLESKEEPTPIESHVEEYSQSSVRRLATAWWKNLSEDKVAEVMGDSPLFVTSDIVDAWVKCQADEIKKHQYNFSNVVLGKNKNQPEEKIFNVKASDHNNVAKHTIKELKLNPEDGDLFCDIKTSNVYGFFNGEWHRFVSGKDGKVKIQF